MYVTVIGVEDYLRVREEEVRGLRERFDPRRRGFRLRILFVGESPPEGAPETFFYNRNTPLYCATFLAFHRKFGVREDVFLDRFVEMGCYLYDLFDTPGMKLSHATQEQVEEVLDRLRKLVEDAKPETVVVVGKKLFEAVKGLLEGLKSRGVVKQYYCLPFPNNARRCAKYLEELQSILDRVAATP